MELLYELESQADEFVVERLRRTIADALSQYKPMCEECDVAMARHHSYERTLITKYGEMRLDVPVFRCGDCGAMTSGMDVIGKGQAGAKALFQKKYGMRRCGLRRRESAASAWARCLGSPKARCASG